MGKHWYHLDIDVILSVLVLQMIPLKHGHVGCVAEVYVVIGLTGTN